MGLYLGKSGWHIRWCWGNKKTTFGLLEGDLNEGNVFALSSNFFSLYFLSFFIQSAWVWVAWGTLMTFSPFLFFIRIWSGFSITWLDWNLGKRSGQ